MSKKAGGGVLSNRNVKVPVRGGQPARGVNPGYAGQIGSHLTSRSASEPMNTAKPYSAPAGNLVAGDVGGGGPGKGRTLYGQSGTQGQHGPVARGENVPGRRDILSEFGPEKKIG